MTEKLICIVTPTKRCYIRATSIATEFLDKDQNLIHIAGTIPDGEIHEIKVATKTIKHYQHGKLEGELSMIDLASGKVTFTEQYKDGVLVDLADYTLPGVPVPILKTNDSPTYQGTTVKTNKQTQSFYVNGKEVAEQTLAPDGTTIEQLGDIPDGAVKEFDENGQLRLETTYHNNQREGELLRYDEQNRLISRESYTEGKLQGSAQYFTYINDGPITIHATYKNMQLEGPWISSFPNGKPCIQATYQNGKLQGTRTTLYENGQINIQETFENGKLEGTRKIYYPHGTLWYIEHYKNNRLDGERVGYFANGNKYLEEFYTDGLLEGERKTYTDSGDLLSQENYHWGSLVHNTERRPAK